MRTKALGPHIVALAVTAAAVIAGALIPLLFDARFYFVDVTQLRTIGQWYEIGTRVLAGDWSLVDPGSWQAGNYAADVSWGIFSPILWLIGVASHAATSALVFMTGVTIAFLVIAGLGIYGLARTFGADRAWSVVAGVAAPLSGFTLYIYAASWANGLVASCLIPLSWMLLRRSVFQGKSPVLAVAGAAAVIGIGDAHATLFLAGILAATIIEAWLSPSRSPSRSPSPGPSTSTSTRLSRHQYTPPQEPQAPTGHTSTPSLRRAWLLFICAGLFAVIVYLPWLVTLPVTSATRGIHNSGLLTIDVSALAASATPVGTPQITFFSQHFPFAPLSYIAWFLPFLAFVEWRRLMWLLRARLSLPIVLALAVLGSLGPADVGPLSFPAQLLSYVATALVLIVAVGLSRARVPVVNRLRFGFACAWVLVSAYIAFGQGPQYRKVLAVVVIAQLIGVWIVYRIFTPDRWPWRGRAHHAVGLAATLTVIATVGFLVPQHYSSRRPPLPDYHVPTAMADYRSQLADAEGDVIVVGKVPAADRTPELWQETLPGDLWYVNRGERGSVQNLYTANSVDYPPYASATCMADTGFTCSDLYDRLFAPWQALPSGPADEAAPLADLLALSSVQLIMHPFYTGVMQQAGDAAPWAIPPPLVPTGWHIADTTRLTMLLVRDRPVPPAGGVVWQSTGTSVTTLHENAMGVTFRVDTVGSAGGEVALSRIPWLGYTVTGAAIAREPVGGFLLDVTLEPGSAGSTVTVSFHSPGWQGQVAAAVLLLLAILASLHVFGRRWSW